MNIFLNKILSEHILIIGFSITGLSCANYLLSKGVKVSISDSKPLKQLEKLVKRLIKPPLFFYTDKQDKSQLKGVDRILLSPGVPRNIDIIYYAKKLSIPILTEIEFSYMLMQSSPAKKLIAITGTDGKSTSCYFLYQILKKISNVKLLGNIGKPLIDAIDEIDFDTYLVLELSSYMLEDISCFRPDVACILNLAEDHLDRYHSFETYRKTKYNIFKYQKNPDFAVLNYDDLWYAENLSYVNTAFLSFSEKYNGDFYFSSSYDKSFLAKSYFQINEDFYNDFSCFEKNLLCDNEVFNNVEMKNTKTFNDFDSNLFYNNNSFHNNLKAMHFLNKTTKNNKFSFNTLLYRFPDVYLRDSFIYFRSVKLFNIYDLSYYSRNYISNVLCATCVCVGLGFCYDLISDLLKGLEGLKHRNEFVAEYRGIKFINDSKATTIQALSKALFLFDSSVVLIMGGVSKGLDFSLLDAHFNQNLRKIVIFGQDARKIANQISFSCHIVSDLEEAFAFALKIALPGDIVLFSPACASFDQYENYQKRGEHFISLVKALI